MHEHDLIRKCKEGHIESFEKLIENHQVRVYNIALKMLKNEQDAYDVAQDVFIKIYKSIGSFNENSQFSTWLYRITTNVCLDYIRKNKNKRSISIDTKITQDENEISFELEDKNINIEGDILKLERQKVIEDALLLLNEDHRKMIIFRDIENFSYEEIAKITGLNIGTVKSKINRARIALRKILLKDKELFE